MFYCGRLVKGGDPASFEVINKEGYAKDDKRVYLECYPLLFSDPKSFEYLEYPYSRDKDRVYCGIIPLALDKGEVAAFRVTNTDQLMVGMRSTMVTWNFIEQNPEYKWVDTLGLDMVLVGPWGTGETSRRKFKGFREVQ